MFLFKIVVINHYLKHPYLSCQLSELIVDSFLTFVLFKKVLCYAIFWKVILLCEPHELCVQPHKVYVSQHMQDLTCAFHSLAHALVSACTTLILLNPVFYFQYSYLLYLKAN